MFESDPVFVYLFMGIAFWSGLSFGIQVSILKKRGVKKKGSQEKIFKTP